VKARMPKADAPCMECTNRTVGCHSKCEVYAEWNSQWKKIRSEIKQKAREEEIVNGYVAREVCKGTGKKLSMY